MLFKNFFYYFANEECRDVFIKNPERFVEKVIFSSERNCPLRLRPHKAAELIAQDKHLLGHCPVTLKDDERVEKGNPLLIVQFKENRFLFANEEKLTKFYANPTRYATIQLPVKMPASVDPVSLY